MIVYRLSRAAYKDDLSGYGASLHGQRWNSKGTEVIYTAMSRCLANIEISVHLNISFIPSDYHLIEIYIPDDVEIESIPLKKLPLQWNALPPKAYSMNYGDGFIDRNEKLLLKVPSAVVKDEYNIIINPNHKDFKRIKIVNSEQFPIDKRLYS